MQHFSLKNNQRKLQYKLTPKNSSSKAKKDNERFQGNRLVTVPKIPSLQVSGTTRSATRVANKRNLSNLPPSPHRATKGLRKLY